MRFISILTIVALTAMITIASSAQTTAFNYQGRLGDGGAPANGIYDLRFTLFDSSTNGAVQGAALTNTATIVANGLFNTTLDFGNQFPGADRWLEIAVRTNGGGAFTVLNPRQPLVPVPYAITAGNVLPGGLPSGVYTNAIVFNNASNVIAGNGAGITGLNASSISTGALPLTQLAESVVTNSLWWELATNKTAIFNGKRYDFASSTSSGINEIMALSPVVSTNNSGICIRLGPGIYNFETPLILPNNVTIIGAGEWNTVLMYDGPINIFAADQVAAIPKGADSIIFAGAKNCGLIQLPPYNGPALWTAPLGYSYLFENFTVTTASNLPAALLDGMASRMTLDHISLLGVGGLSQAAAGSLFLPPAGYSTVDSLTVGAVVWVWNKFVVNDCWAWGLADGIANVGNSFFTVNDLEAVTIGFDNGIGGNGYPENSWLGKGFAIYTGREGYNSEGSCSADIERLAPVLNNVDIWVDANSAKIGYASWQQSNYNIARSGNCAIYLEGFTDYGSLSFLDLDGGLNPTNAAQGTIVYNQAGNWSMNGIIHSTAGGYFRGTFTGSGSDLTNIPAAQLTGTVPTASLPGITTNISASGVTFYITNGLIMRVTTP